jgi:hypothetical protein
MTMIGEQPFGRMESLDDNTEKDLDYESGKGKTER